MAGNANSSMGRLLTFIGDELNLAISQINEVSPKAIKKGIRYADLEPGEEWKIFPYTS